MPELSQETKRYIESAVGEMLIDYVVEEVGRKKVDIHNLLDGYIKKIESELRPKIAAAVDEMITQKVKKRMEQRND